MTNKKYSVKLILSSNKKGEKFFIDNNMSYWVKFTIEKVSRLEIIEINKNKEYLSQYLSRQLDDLTMTSIKYLSGWDVRLINIYIMMIRGVNHIELNTAGLSLESIRLMYEFVLQESEKGTVRFCVIEPNSCEDDIEINLNRENFCEVFDKYYVG